MSKESFDMHAKNHVMRAHSSPVMYLTRWFILGGLTTSTWRCSMVTRWTCLVVSATKYFMKEVIYNSMKWGASITQIGKSLSVMCVGWVDSTTIRNLWNTKERIIDGPRKQVKIMEMMSNHCLHYIHLWSGSVHWIVFEICNSMALCVIVEHHICHCKCFLLPFFYTIVINCSA